MNQRFEALCDAQGRKKPIASDAPACPVRWAVLSPSRGWPTKRRILDTADNGVLMDVRGIVLSRRSEHNDHYRQHNDAVEDNKCF
jgi:hypothetical protein